MASRLQNFQTRLARACAMTKNTWPIWRRFLKLRPSINAKLSCSMNQTLIFSSQHAMKQNCHKSMTFLLASLLMLPGATFAADINGADLSPLWGIPFAGILLSIAPVSYTHLTLPTK
jgi:hypothetical protein